MSFAAPIWLLGLIPWAALVVWLLSGLHERAAVPFLQLWKGSESHSRVSRSLRMPPVALICLLLTLLLAVLAAARPALNTGAGRLTIVVDRSVRMLPWLEEIQRNVTELLWRYPQSEVDFISVPDGRLGPAGPILPLSSLDNRSALRAVIRDALSRDDAPPFVVSNQSLEIEDKRIVQITGSSLVENVSLVRVAATENPQRQVMVTLRNDSSLTRAVLRVSSQGATVERDIQLPPRGEQSSYFLDQSSLGSLIGVELVVDDHFAPDDRASLTRVQAWPRIETRVALPPELARMVQVYAANRPASEGSTLVAIVELDSPSERAVVLSRTSKRAEIDSSDLQITPHPITKHVDWNQVDLDALIADPPGDGWRPIVAIGNTVLVAVRETPVRQVWVGVSSESFSRTSSFVALWTNIFDWAGEGSQEYAAEPIGAISSDWEPVESAHDQTLVPAPGIYRRQDGVLRAANLLDVRFDPPPRSDWREKLARISSPSRAAAELRGLLLLPALVLAVISALLWASARVKKGHA